MKPRQAICVRLVRLMLAGFWNTHGSMLTGVASLIADRTGGVMSQLSEGAAKPHSVIDANNIQTQFPSNFWFDSLERNRLRVADLGVAGGGRPGPPAAAAEDRKVEK